MLFRMSPACRRQGITISDLKEIENYQSGAKIPLFERKGEEKISGIAILMLKIAIPAFYLQNNKSEFEIPRLRQPVEIRN
ncbi:hypothetical protein MgSA37_02356 [Mucilaginibacter gotjawali]|nr:hypothetical protein MgSA37_02356 [Mucilaginibacter gotjawali]